MVAIQSCFRKQLVTLLAIVVCTMLMSAPAYADEQTSASAQLATEKNETVYIHADASGTPDSIEVESVLRNEAGSETIKDVSTLTDIEPADDYVSYTEKNGELIWTTDGADVTYKGNTDKDIPVKVKVAYTLDGKEMSPADMLGATGHVVVRYDYENETNSDGMKTPFLLVTGILVDDASFSNIKVENGKLIADGDRSIVIGYALPGLQEALQLEADDVTLPDFFSFEADVVDFSLNSSLTMASPSLFDDLKDGDLDISEITDSIAELSDATATLVKAAADFYDGMKDLDDGAVSLKDALKELSESIPDLVSAISTLEEGASGIKTGLDSAVEGLDELSDGASSLEGGLYSALYGDGSTNTGLSGAADGAAALSSGAQSLLEGLKTLSADEGLPALSLAADQLSQALSTESLAPVTAALKAAEQETTSNIELANQIIEIETSVKSYINQAYGILEMLDIDKLNISEEEKTQLQEVEKYLMDASTYQVRIETLCNSIKTDASLAAIGALQAASGALEQASTGSQALSNGLSAIVTSLDEDIVPGAESLSSGSSSLATGLSTAVKGMESLLAGATGISGGLSKLNDEEEGLPAVAAGAGKIEEGLGTLAGGAGDLEEGTNQIADGASNLEEGTAAAVEGAQSLADGLNTYKNEGIDELANSVNNDLKGIVDRLQETADLGKAYENFSGKAEGTPSSVKFVFEIAGITEE